MTHHGTLAPDGASARRALSLATAALLISGCGLPTEIPQVDQRWIAPPQTTTIGVSSLLPVTIRASTDSTRFFVTVDTVAVLRPLSADCAACVSANGTTIAKPPFTATVALATTLPPDLAAATLTGGAVTLSLRNGYNFDPIRPSASARGYVVTTIANGATVIGRDSVDGAITAFAPGAFLSRVIPLSGAVTGNAPVSITITINSPAGDPVQMDVSRALTAVAATKGVQVATAAIVVANRQVASTSVLDLEGVDDAIISHVAGGSLLLDVNNPFAVAGTIQVSFGALGMAPIARSVALVPGASQPTIALGADEVRSMLGRRITVIFSGPVSGTSGAVTVSPRQAVLVRSRLDLTIHTGG